MTFPPELIKYLRAVRKVAALTGAGVSAESGVPTFREAQTGLWARFKAEELATPQAFQRQPQLVWEWYAWRRELVGKAAPNAGHFALAELERRIPEFTLITQNVDGLHHQAGSRQVLELHGNIQRIKCSRDMTLVESWDESGGLPPCCPGCGAHLRPDVVWFGEALPQDTLEAAYAAAQACDLFFSIGTSGLVHPAATLPFTALQSGAVVVEINPIETPLTGSATYVLQGPSGEVLPELINAAFGENRREVT